MSMDITVTDMFCGCGGSTTGATLAGATVKLAINHWDRAIETHNTNYPATEHVLTDLHVASPRRFRRTTMLIASPECTAQSLAKGRKRKGQNQPGLPGMEDEPDLTTEAEERSRCTMWTPLDWAEYHNYQAIILENVVDAHLWRPFQAWLQAWRSLEYDYELVYMNSMHAHPTPQSRDRMYFVAWKRGNRKPDLAFKPRAYCLKHGDIESVQSWKNPTRRHGKYKQQYVYRCPHCAAEVTPYYYAAANAIDWSLPAQRIGDRARPLREKTLKRIAYGLEKFAGEAFTVQVNKTTDCVRSLISEPFPTQTGDNGLAMVRPFLLNLNHPGPRPVIVDRQPFFTQTAYDSTGMVMPPAWLMTYYNNGQMVPVSQAVPTVTTLDRVGLVTGPSVAVEDCGFRMLIPKEIQAAMAFPEEYILTGTRREQVKQLGNAVTPPVMKLLMERVLASLAGYTDAVAV